MGFRGQPSPAPDVHGLAEVDQPLLRRRDSLLLLELLLDLLGLYGFDNRQTIPFIVFLSDLSTLSSGQHEVVGATRRRRDAVETRKNAPCGPARRPSRSERMERGAMASGLVVSRFVPCLSGSYSRQRRGAIVEQRTRSVDHRFARTGERRDSPPCQSESEWGYGSIHQLTASPRTGRDDRLAKSGARVAHSP